MDLSDAILDTIFDTLEDGSVEIRRILQNVKDGNKIGLVSDLDTAAIKIETFTEKLKLIRAGDKDNG